MAERVNQNTAATDGKSFPETGKKLPDAPNGGGTVGPVVLTANMAEQAYQHAVDLAQCSLFVESAPLKRAMMGASAFLRQVSHQRSADPAPIAAALEAAADAADKDAVWCSSDERAIAQVQRASTYRRLAAVLREPGFGEGQS